MTKQYHAGLTVKPAIATCEWNCKWSKHAPLLVQEDRQYQREERVQLYMCSTYAALSPTTCILIYTHTFQPNYY